MVILERDPYMDPPADIDVRAGEPAALALIRRIDRPTLVIHGANDVISPPGTGRRLAALLGGRLEALDGAGHAPMARDPVKVNLLIRDFVRSLGPAA